MNSFSTLEQVFGFLILVYGCIIMWKQHKKFKENK